MSQRVIRVADIATTKHRAGLLPVSPATIWRWVREGKFPKPFKLGDSVTVRDAAAIEGFIANRSNGSALAGERQS
jgi:prophage regulatory protein